MQMIARRLSPVERASNQTSLFLRIILQNLPVQDRIDAVVPLETFFEHVSHHMRFHREPSLTDEVADAVDHAVSIAGHSVGYKNDEINQ
jgi:hypothetical protein